MSNLNYDKGFSVDFVCKKSKTIEKLTDDDEGPEIVERRW